MLKQLPLPILLPLLICGLLVSMVWSLSFGIAEIGFTRMLEILLHPFTNNPTDPQSVIVWQLRVPRMLLGVLAGFSLAVIGAALQALTRNPLADPYLFGIASGASLGAVTAFLWLPGLLGIFTLPLFAFFGAMFALVLVLSLAGRQATTERLILSGVAGSFLLMAGANLLLYLGDPKATTSVIFWMMGGLERARWIELWPPLITTIGGLLVLLWHAPQLNALLLGEESAHTLGVKVKQLRWKLFTVTALMTATIVSLCGAIGFVGLMIPHITRVLCGSDNRRLLICGGFIGGIFLLWVDVLARKILAPQELPLGIITAVIGSLFFIILMHRRN